MSEKNILIQEIASLVLKSEDVLDNTWAQAAFVFDVRSGAISNSGFLYSGEKIIPAIADIEGEPLLLDNKIVELQRTIEAECQQNFKQLLVQLDNESGRFKIEFEFDSFDRWSFNPSNYAKIKQDIRPQFH